MALPSSVLSRRKEPLDDFAQPVLGVLGQERAELGLGDGVSNTAPRVHGGAEVPCPSDQGRVNGRSVQRIVDLG
jgi:hypothetical protein